MKITTKLLFLSLLCSTLLLTFSFAIAGPTVRPLKQINALIIGERVMDIANSLGYAPKAFVGRYSLWDMGDQIGKATDILGCPVKICKKSPDIVPNALDKMKIKRVIIEKHPEYCLYKKINPSCILNKIKGRKDLSIEFVDFSNGLAQAVHKTAKLIGCSEKAAGLMAKYDKNMELAKKNLIKAMPKQKVVLLSGTFQRNTGKTFLRVEAPGGYSDRYMLAPLKAENVGNALASKSAKIAKGHFTIRKLTGLAMANPDIIVIFGDVAAVQKALHKATIKHPELANVKALKNNAVYSLPFYADCGPLEYPVHLNKWACMFR